MAKKKVKLRNLIRNPQYAVLRECKWTGPGHAALGPVGAHSMGIGRKSTAGNATNKLCLRYYVSKKRPLSRISGTERIPETFRYFSRKKRKDVTVTTDIIESPPAQLEAVDPETRFRPVPGGVSGGIAAHTGTIGGWVWDTLDDTIVMLSNDHVFESTLGVDILQQGTADGGSLPADKIGDVKRGIPRSDTVPNTVDCAIGDPDATAIYDLNVLEIGPAVVAIEVAALDMLVEKYGQTTRHTFGEITDTDWSGFVSGRPFDDCLRVDAVAPSNDWSGGGDSGSLVFSQTPIESGSEIKPVVGLHFAGADTHGIECKIQNVFARLNLTTLCAGAFAAFLDALFEAETQGEVSDEAEGRLRTISALAAGRPPRFLPPAFVRRERERAGSNRFFAGISRELRDRIQGCTKGRVVTRFVDQHRAELLNLLTKDGDIRRATVAALAPLVAGATTTTDVLERVMTAGDLDNLDKLSREVESKGSSRLKPALKMVRALRSKAEGRSLAEILELKR